MNGPIRRAREKVRARIAGKCEGIYGTIVGFKDVNEF
jgi:hypothetical protein